MLRISVPHLKQLSLEILHVELSLDALEVFEAAIKDTEISKPPVFHRRLPGMFWQSQAPQKKGLEKNMQNFLVKSPRTNLAAANKDLRRKFVGP